MLVHHTYWMWTRGTFSASHTVRLNRSRRYLVTGGLTGRSGGGYGQVYISVVCRESGDQVLCGLRDDPQGSPEDAIAGLGLYEILSGATRVTLTLRGAGGLHRAEGAVYDIT